MRVARTLVALLVALSGAVVASHRSAEATPEGFESTNVITGLSRPTNVEFSPDGRVFISEQSGVLKVFDDVNDSSSTNVIDLRPYVHSVNGRGMLGLALDPDFPSTPHIYVMYSLDAPIGGTPPTYGTVTGSNDECPLPPGPGKCVIGARISRLVLDGDVAVTETTILEDWCQEWTSHSIGDLRFDSQGALFATGGDGAFAGQPDWGQKAGRNGCGDPPIPHGGADQPPATAEGGALRSQDLRTSGDPAGLSGTVIRIDKNTGEAHPDNPNFGHDDPNVARIVAYGLRNPYRTALRPGTDELWLGDVGWNDWEELNVVADADSEVLNFGWPCYEGPDLGYDVGADICTDLVAEGPGAVEAPYWVYEQRNGIVEGDGCLNNNGSLSALTFYEGGAYPDEHDGAFFFGDYSRRCIWEMLAGPDGRPDPSTARVINDDIAVTDLAIGPGGDVYALNVFGGGPIGGTLVRLSYPNGVAEPTARLSVSPSQGPAPLSVTLDASATTPSFPGQELTFDWDLDGDGEFGEFDGAVVNAVYEYDGVFTAQVRVTDPNGQSDVASQVIRVGTPPVVTITSPTVETTWKVDDTLPFAGSAVDSDGETIPAGDLEWDLIFHHCETLEDCHTHNIGTVEGVESGSFVAPEHEYPTYIEVALTATTAEGLSTTTSVDLFPITTTLTLDAVDPGLTLGFNGKPVSTPSVNEVIVGTNNTVSSPASQSLGLTTYLFETWSDGGPRTHDVFVGEPTTVIATHTAIEQPTGTSVDGVGTAPSASATSSEASIRLDWSAVARAERYRVRIRTGSGSWQPIEQVGTSLSHVFDGLSSSTGYTVAVSSRVGGKWRNEWSAITIATQDPGGGTTGGTTGGDTGGSDTTGGDTGGSDTTGGTTGGDTGTSVDGVGTAPSASAVASEASIRLDWSAVARAERYRVRIRTGSGSWQPIEQVGTSLSHVFDGLSSSTGYTVAVSSRVGGKWRNEWSAITIATQDPGGGTTGGDTGGTTGGDTDGTTGGDTGGTTGGTDTGELVVPGTSTAPTMRLDISDDSIDVRWDPIDTAVRYQFRFKRNSLRWSWDTPTTETSRALRNLNEDDAYTIEVRALIDRVWNEWNSVVVIPAAGA